MQAALGAGYSEQYSQKKGWKLLDLEQVRSYVKKLRERMNQRAEKSATDVVNEYAKIAFADRVSFLKEDPDKPGDFIYKSPDELTDDQRAVVEKVTMHTNEIFVEDEEGKRRSIFRQEYNYVFSDKQTALHQMGRHFGIFDDKLRLTTQTNQFKNLSSEQLLQLKSAVANVMSGAIIDGQTGAVIGYDPTPTKQ